MMAAPGIRDGHYLRFSPTMAILIISPTPPMNWMILRPASKTNSVYWAIFSGVKSCVDPERLTAAIAFREKLKDRAGNTFASLRCLFIIHKAYLAYRLEASGFCIRVGSVIVFGVWGIKSIFFSSSCCLLSGKKARLLFLSSRRKQAAVALFGQVAEVTTPRLKFSK